MIRFTRHSLKPKISGTLFIIAAMVSLFLIAGCSNSSNNSQSEATDSPASQSTPAPTTSLAPTPSAVSDPIALQVAEMTLEEKSDKCS